MSQKKNTVVDSSCCFFLGALYDTWNQTEVYESLQLQLHDYKTIWLCIADKIVGEEIQKVSGVK